MSSNDIAIGVTAGMPVQGALSKRPPHLITLEDTKGKLPAKTQKFLAIDKPEFLNGFVQAKGIFTDASEDEISKNFFEMLSSSPRELVLDMIFPWHKISNIRNLLFKAK